MREVPITEAKNALTALVHQAEAGKPTRLTRRGKPVAVLLSEEAYNRLRVGAAERRDLWAFVEQWRAGLGPHAEGISAAEVSGWRDRATGRPSPWES
jgi:prevent-host-death family protein